MNQLSRESVRPDPVAIYLAWLKGKKPDGGQRKDTAMRVFIDAEDKYLEKWDLLGL